MESPQIRRYGFVWSSWMILGKDAPKNTSVQEAQGVRSEIDTTGLAAGCKVEKPSGYHGLVWPWTARLVSPTVDIDLRGYETTESQRFPLTWMQMK